MCEQKEKKVVPLRIEKKGKEDSNHKDKFPPLEKSPLIKLGPSQPPSQGSKDGTRSSKVGGEASEGLQERL